MWRDSNIGPEVFSQNQGSMCFGCVYGTRLYMCTLYVWVGGEEDSLGTEGTQFRRWEKREHEGSISRRKEKSSLRSSARVEKETQSVYTSSYRGVSDNRPIRCLHDNRIPSPQYGPASEALSCRSIPCPNELVLQYSAS